MFLRKEVDTLSNFGKSSAHLNTFEVYTRMWKVCYGNRKIKNSTLSLVHFIRLLGNREGNIIFFNCNQILHYLNSNVSMFSSIIY